MFFSTSTSDSIYAVVNQLKLDEHALTDMQKNIRISKFERGHGEGQNDRK